MAEQDVEVIAYAHGDGVIGYVQTNHGGIPEGALFIAAGPDEILRECIGGLCRRGLANVALVPGVPEAEEHETAYKAFLAFFNRVQVQLGPNSNIPSIRERAPCPP